MEKFIPWFCLFCILTFGVSLGRAQEEPAELTKVKKEYTAELEKALKPVNERYVPKLEELKKQLTLKGDIKGALAIEQATEKMSAGQPLGQGNANEPQEMREIRKNYNSELEAAIKPVKSLYTAKLEVLKQQLAIGGNLKGALAVEEEMGKANDSAVSQNMPTGAVAWKNHWYKIYDEKVVWPEARAICKDIGGHLAIINDMEENDFVTRLSGGRPFLWIGASDKPKTGRFTWIDGRPMTFQNWDKTFPVGKGQPDNGPIEYYVSISSSGGWHDHNEPDKLSFICEGE